MGCARCSMCGIHYPAFKSVCEVTGCGEVLSPFTNIEPDTDWREQVRVLNEALDVAATSAVDELRAHRVAQFERIGFPDYAAEVLADARDTTGFPLWWGRVADAIERGATHAQALRIYA